jgi:hypothetical protein
VQNLTLAGLLNINFSLNLHMVPVDIYQGTFAPSGFI